MFDLQSNNLMGNCNSQQISTPKQDQKVFISAQAQAGTQTLFNKFTICKHLASMLDGSTAYQMDGVAYTQNQAIDLAKALFQGVVQLEKQENCQSKLDVQNIFNPTNIDLIKKQQLFYNGILQKLNKKDLSQNIKSRVYHKIANIKKDTKIDGLLQNKYGILCSKNNDYKVLAQAQLDEVVKYQTISDHVTKFGDKISFKFESIKRQSDTILKLISKVLVDHIAQINKLQYGLKLQEVMKMAAISRDACNYYDNGVFLLLIYFVQSCKKLQNAGKSSEEIEKLLNDAIQNISKQYPPGQGLSKQNAPLITALQSLEVKKQGKFSHKQTPMQPSEKQAQVQKIILNNAKIAEQCKDLFQQLVKATCFQRAVLFKIGLKLYPQNPNKKAMMRIKEKMFFAKDQKGEKNMKGKIEQILIREDTNYRNIIDVLLETSTSVPFKISDMVRGKCVFLEVSDIIETVKQINEFVKNDQRFAIQEIQSRFGNKTPISDVTLKIVINNKIVAELQLTIQTNAAAYHFAHKIYQLQRTKVFSKLKIIHNYFQESNYDFSQLVNRSLSLLTSKSILSLNISNNIKAYFKLDSIKMKPFREILSGILQQKKALIPAFIVTVDPLLQDLMLVNFAMATGMWYKPLGKIINSALNQKSLSSQTKSVLLSSFFERFSLPKESQFMQQLGFTNEKNEKIFIDQYIKQYFSIYNCLSYVKQNHRLFHRIRQLTFIKFKKQNEIAPIELQYSCFAVNLILEQNCLQNIMKLKQMFDFYFVTRRQMEYGRTQILGQFSNYYNWINVQLNGNKTIDKEELLKSQISIIKAQQLLLKDKVQQASNILEQVKKIFKSKEKLEKVLQCDILLTECFIRTSKSTLKDCKNKHNLEVIKKAETMGLQLKGALYADSLWRISEFLWQVIKDGNEKKLLLDSFTKMAIRQMSRSKGIQLIYALMKRWKQFGQKQNFQNLLLTNEKISYAKLTNLQAIGCVYLTMPKWINLSKLDLSKNDIKDEGCKYLIKGKWNNLTNIDLGMNQIGPKGCEILATANWKKLTELNIWFNNVGAEGCKYLSNGDWKNLTHLNIYMNNIGNEGCKYLSIAKWENLTDLYLGQNQIGPEGCKYLSAAKWKNFSELYLGENVIGAEGCKFISAADWKNLSKLNLNSNKIGNEGCKHLSIAKWPVLKKLHLNKNEITEEGCNHLSTAKWQSLAIMDLGKNEIDQQKYKQLESKFTQKSLSINWYHIIY